MNRILLLLILLIESNSAQIRSQFISVQSPPSYDADDTLIPRMYLQRINTPPYHAGDTIKFCAICTKNIPAESLFISTNLFSPATKPAPVIFSGSKSIIINNPDTSWKYLLNHTSEHCDTISFVAYYAPFPYDSLFYIQFKMVGYETSKLTYRNTDSTLNESVNLVPTAISKQSNKPNYVNLLGRKFEMESKYQTLTKKGLVSIGILR